MNAALRRRLVVTLPIVVCSALVQVVSGSGLARAGEETRQTINLRGHDQMLHLYGTRGGRPVIVSSGDGGWIHLAPHVAEVLSANGCFVVGFDARAYLESFTNGGATVRVEDEPGDYWTLIEFAARETGRFAGPPARTALADGARGAKPVLIGVSEGAGLSVLAATDPRNKKAVAGVIGLGLSDLTELGWRWKDMAIYLTHGTPHEPTFSVKTVVDRMGPVPLAAIHSTRDEYVPLAEVQQVLERAGQPKRLWIVNAANHRFSDNLAEFDRTLLEAIAWTLKN
jgi:dienelactone hydrolase